MQPLIFYALVILKTILHAPYKSCASINFYKKFLLSLANIMELAHLKDIHIRFLFSSK